MIGVAIGIWTRDPMAGLAAGIGCLAGIPITPDLDQEGVSGIEWDIVKKSLGLGFLWLAFWWPYARCIEHRKIWSHLPALGTTIRLGYIGIAVIVLASAWIPLDFQLHPWMTWYGGWGVLGLVVSDAGHWVCDRFPIRL